MLLQQFARDVAAGFSASPKRVPCKYLYDDEGSRLFTEIMDLEEYYPTRCEAEIIEDHAEEIAGILDSQPFNVVELGAGDGRKTMILLRRFLDRQLAFRYVPIDICQAAIASLAEALRSDFPGLNVDGLSTEYFDGIKWLSRSSGDRNIVLFLGSNIGNFRPSEARAFLSGLRGAMETDDILLIGFDLKKEARLLVSAYNDSKGVTARFNLNMLHRINNELRGDFDVHQFQYYSTYDPRSSAVESFLVSTKKQAVHIKSCSMAFDVTQWEPIHTESSYKFDIEELPRLASRNGFHQLACFTDSRHYFADALWQAG